MLTPMTSEELRRHRSMGLYKTQADMEKDTTRPVQTARALKATPTTILYPILDILPPAQYDIQGHDD